MGNYNVNKYTNSRFGADLSKVREIMLFIGKPMGRSIVISNSKVITELTDTDPSRCTLVKGRSSGGLICKVNWAQLWAYLQKVKLYDQNVR